MKKTNKKGFTLAELLVVVAIIAVLVAIAIPIFTAQLEKAREATDEANIRAAYAEVIVATLNDDATNTTQTVELTQQENGWKTTPKWPDNLTETGSPTKGYIATITATDTGATVTYAAKSTSGNTQAGN